MLNTEDLETLPLGQTKQSDYDTPKNNGTMTNLVYDMNRSISPCSVRDVSRNANDSISGASSTQTRHKITKTCLPK